MTPAAIETGFQPLRLRSERDADGADAGDRWAVLTPLLGPRPVYGWERAVSVPGMLRADLRGPAFGPRPMSPISLASLLERPKPPPKLRPFFALPLEEEAEQPLPFVVPTPVAVQEFILPFERGRVTSMFHQGRYHPAIDLAGPLGTPVHATTRRQKVTFAGRRGGYGNLVVTRDPQGRQHYYGHLQRITARVGAMLDQGQPLGLLGSTGRSTGPHVHYEVRTRTGRHLDPAPLLFPGHRVTRGFAWNGARSVTRVAARTDQPRPR